MWTGSQLVAVGDHGTILTSPDGTLWSQRLSGTSAYLAAVTWTGTQFVTVGAEGTTLTSADGITWTSHTVAGSTWLFSSVTWTGTQLVAMGSDSYIGAYGHVTQWYLFTSADGTAWTRTDFTQTSGADRLAILWTGTQLVVVDMFGEKFLYGVTWTGSQFVAVGSHGTIVTRPDTTTPWTLRTSGAVDVGFGAVIWTGTQLVAVGTGIFTSPDGETWTQRWLGKNEGVGSVAWTGTQLVAVGSGTTGWGGRSYGLILTSPDGVVWTSHPTDAGALGGVVWTGFRLVVGGTGAKILTSRDGSSWTPHLVPGYNSIGGMVWTGTRLVAIGNDQQSHSDVIVTSPDGEYWTECSSPIPQRALVTLAWTGSQVVAVGYGVILTSPDGCSWTTQVSGSKASLQAVTWTGSILAAAGYDWSTTLPLVLTSPDGVNWTPTSPAMMSESENWVGVTGTGSQLVVVGSEGTIMSSDCPVSCTAPSITTQPRSQLNPSSRSVSISVSGSGAPPLSYQWYKGTIGDTSRPLWLEPAGSDSNTYVIPSWEAERTYWVRVSNPCGSVDSEPVTASSAWFVRRRLDRQP